MKLECPEFDMAEFWSVLELLLSIAIRISMFYEFENTHSIRLK